MIKKIFLILLLVLSFFIVGCNQNSVNIDIDYNRGTDGVETEYALNSPPREIPENEDFSVIVRIKNLGATDVTQLYHELNYDPLYFSLNKTEDPYGINKIDELLNLFKKGKKVFDEIMLTNTIHGKSRSYPFGDETYMEYQLKSNQLKGQLQNPTTTIDSVLCYVYSTKFADEICIERDATRNNYLAKPCKSEDNNYLDGQGGPVAITRVETDFIKQGSDIKPTFKIYLQNMNDGFVVKRNKVFNVCKGETIGINDWNSVEIEAFLSGVPLNCGTGIVNLNSPNPSIRCASENAERFDLGGAAYSRILQVTANYGYFDEVQRDVTILRNR